MAATANSDAAASAEKGLVNMSNMANLCDSGRVNAYDRSNDPFGSESNGTAKFIGSCGGAMGNAGSASGSGRFDFHTIKAANNNNQRTIRNDLPKNELIKMLCYLEGELQARDVVIAALRNERVKQFLTQLCAKPVQPTDPHAALFRDKISLAGNLVSRDSSAAAVQAEMEVRTIIEQQMESLYQMVTKQRSTHVRMVNILTESLENNQRMRQELEEEKRKHEHDTAQGDDITYGLEMERTKLKQELETERTQRKKLEKDMKKLQETIETERTREKQIVLYLIAERKRILMKYIEEGKRSEDLAQILSEEKQRSDAIAEGLEEESKKSLRMEADIEKQTVTFDNERKALKLNMAKDEKRIKDLETELAQLRNEVDTLKKQNSVTMRMQSAHNVPVPTLPAKVRSIAGDDMAGAPMVNVAKIVQPTATVSSVPVSGPTTGIAQSISPGQSLRQQANILSSDTSGSSSVGFSAPPAKISNTTSAYKPIPTTIGAVDEIFSSTTPSYLPTTSQSAPAATLNCSSSSQPSPPPHKPPSPHALHPSVIMMCNDNGLVVDNLAAGDGEQFLVTATALGTNSSSQVVHSQQQQPPPPSSPLLLLSSTATILRSGAIATSAVTSSAPIANSTANPLSISSTSSSGAAAATLTATPGVINNIVPVVTPAATATAAPSTTTATNARGAPPPIPPNKPVVPPKREPSISRLNSVTNNSK